MTPQHGPDGSSEEAILPTENQGSSSKLFHSKKGSLYERPSLGSSSFSSVLSGKDGSYHNNTFQAALEQTEDGTTSQWVNPETGNNGNVTPTRYYQNDKGAYCREFSQIVVIDGDKQKTYGTACRQTGGIWKIIS